jgi:hypothetical protein
MNDALKLFVLILLVVAIVVIGPLLLIWSLNTLFPVLAIPYEITTWAAALILSATITSVKAKKKD